jgi:hypothetical protein
MPRADFFHRTTRLLQICRNTNILVYPAYLVPMNPDYPPQVMESVIAPDMEMKISCMDRFSLKGLEFDHTCVS